MLILLIPLITIIAFIMVVKNKNLQMVKIVIRIILISNILLMLFIKLGSSLLITSVFWIMLIINVATILIVFNKKMIENNKLLASILIIYFISVLALPVYKGYDFEKYWQENNVSIDMLEEYVVYYNGYGIKLFPNNN